jgi:hypothetical protein
MSIQLHETVMGRRLIEHTLPKIGNALEKIAKGMEKPKEKEWYVVFTATHDLFNEGKTIDNTQMFESKEEAKAAYEKAMKLENLHSVGMARLMEGTDWA